MKRFFALMLVALIFIMSASGCKPKEDVTEPSTEPPTEASTEAPTEELTELPTEESTELSIELTTEPATEPPQNNGPQAVTVNFERILSTYKEYAVVTGLDENGETVWQYETETYEATQLNRTNEIGINKGIYYFVDDRAVVALRVSDGSLLWKNDEFIGDGIASVFGEDDTLYICGYFGPDFFAVDKNGNTLCRIDELDSDYFWPYKLELQGNQVIVTFEGSSFGYGDDHQCCVNLNDYTYYFL